MRTTGVFLDTRTLAACTGDYGATPELAVDLLGSGRALASNCVSGSEAGRACFAETVAGRGALPACSWRACSQRARPRHRMACLRQRSPPPVSNDCSGQVLHASGTTHPAPKPPATATTLASATPAIGRNHRGAAEPTSVSPVVCAAVAPGGGIFQNAALCETAVS